MDANTLRRLRHAVIVGVYLAWLKRPVRIYEIAQALGMAHETVSGYLHDLAAEGLVARTSHGWQLSQGLKSAEIPRKNRGKSADLTSTTTSIFNLINSDSESEEEAVVESKSAENPRKIRGDSANLQTMLLYGIAANERTRRLAALPHVDGRYIEDHVRAARRKGETIGLAIVRMENGEQPDLSEDEKRERWLREFCGECNQSPCVCDVK
jgi:hypothetical protein